MTNEPKTVGDLISEAVKSGDQGAINAAMAQFWKGAKKLGLPVPTDEEIDKIVADTAFSTDKDDQ